MKEPGSHGPLRLLLAGFLLITGCGLSASNTVGRGVDSGASVDVDAPSLDVALDAPEADVPAADASPDVGGRCPDDRFCPPGQRCIGGRCALDPCDTPENVCGAGHCAARCVPLRDPCAGVRCVASETCFGGRCVAGCFSAPCNGVTCADGEFCDAGTGRCAPV